MKGFLIFLGTVAAAGTAYWLYTKNSTPQPVVSDVVLSPQLDYNKVLKYGVRGEEVKELQQRLGGLVVDGIFGTKTQSRLKSVKNVIEITLNQF
ncbi:hypothetical protein [Flavobacterium sp. CAU 1735]|uniref:peptidoglycan-binding domain-containing protein n=1 Tax=Flavobacterium sp. CAU 1735 TaxID=3140361 RepID=UPI003260A972